MKGQTKDRERTKQKQTKTTNQKKVKSGKQ